MGGSILGAIVYVTSTEDQRRKLVRQYFTALTASDFQTILGMFEKDATVTSPFLGEIPAEPFFEKLARASLKSRLTVFDVLLSEDRPSAAAHFEYEWTLKSGETVVFQGFDAFAFAPSGRFAALYIVYDTYPVRAVVGDKYSEA